MDPTETAERRRMEVKVYVVLQRINLPRADAPNARILSARLTHRAAQELSDRIPGTWVEKHVATK